MLTFQHLLWESHEEKKTIYHHICVHFHKNFHNMHQKRNTLLQPKNAHGGGQCGGIISLKPVDGGLNNLKKWNHANVRPRVRPTPWLVLLWRWYTILGHTKHSMNLWLTSIYLKRKLSLERIQAQVQPHGFPLPLTNCQKEPSFHAFEMILLPLTSWLILLKIRRPKSPEEVGETPSLLNWLQHGCLGIVALR